MAKKTRFQEALSIAHRDWRLQGITTVAAPAVSPAGRAVAVGTPVELVQFVRLGSALVTAPVPSAPGLYLSLAAKAAREAQRIEAEVQNTLQPPLNSRTQHVAAEGDSLIFDYYEQIVACVVFSHSAVEAFANELLPDAHTYSRSRNDGRCTEIYTKEQIERFIPLEEKLHAILPELLGVRTPKGMKHWESFVKLAELRNSFIHLKDRDWRRSSPKEGADNLLWTRAIKLPYGKAPTQVADLMRHYYPRSLPRWLAKFGE